MHIVRSARILFTTAALLVATITLPLSQPTRIRVEAATTTSSLQKQLDALKKQEEAKKAEAKRQADLKAKADAKIRELGTQITQLSSNIEKTQDEIVHTNDEIGTKNQQIAELESKMRQIKDQQDVLLREMYMMRASMPDSMQIFSNQQLSEREAEQARFSALKKSVAALYIKTTAAKQEIEATRAQLVERTNSLASLREQQDAQKQGLASHQQTQAQLKVSAEATLKQIEADLLKLRQQEAAVQNQINALIAAALANSAKGIFGSGPGVGTRVSRGQRVGTQGSTGFSTGDHVHFETRVNNVPVNPQPYINNGTLGWPMSSFTITQPFGRTSFSYVYAGGIHTGIDMAGPSGSPVYAPADGTVIVNSCPNGCNSGYGHLWAMQMDSGLVVMLGHLR